MRPPICDVCGERVVGDAGGLVRFASRPSDIEWRERVERDGLVGHPPDTGWFCGDHVEAARSLTASSYPDAMAQLIEPPVPPVPPLPPESAQLSSAEAASLQRHGITDYRLTPTVHTGQHAAISVPIRRRAVSEVVDVFITALPQVAAAVGAPDPPPLERTNHRGWTPMDGSVAPNCPFSDEVRRTARVGDHEFLVNDDVSYWNEDDASNGGCYLSIIYRPTDPDADVAVGWSVRVSAGSHDAVGPIVYVDSITIWQPMPDAFVAVMADVLAVLR